MDFRALRSVVLVANSGSIKQVADETHVTGPAVHKQLKVLQEELSVRLYERRGRRLRLTPAAEILLPYFRDIVAQHNAAFAALEEWKGGRRAFCELRQVRSSVVSCFPIC